MRFRKIYPAGHDHEYSRPAWRSPQSGKLRLSASNRGYGLPPWCNSLFECGRPVLSGDFAVWLLSVVRLDRAKVEFIRVHSWLY